MIEVPEQHQPEPEPSPERSRMTTLGHRTDDGVSCLLLFIHEADGSWTIHGLGDIGIRLTSERMAVLAGAIVRQSR